MAKAESATPISLSDSFKSRVIAGAASEIHTRSMYVMMLSVTGEDDHPIASLGGGGNHGRHGHELGIISRILGKRHSVSAQKVQYSAGSSRISSRISRARLSIEC